MFEGVISKIVADRFFGFISSPDLDKDVFFHGSDLADGLELNDQLKGRRVMFRVVDSAKGQRAERITPALD